MAHIIPTWLSQTVAAIAAPKAGTLGKDRLRQSLGPRNNTVAVIT